MHAVQVHATKTLLGLRSDINLGSLVYGLDRLIVRSNDPQVTPEERYAISEALRAVVGEFKPIPAAMLHQEAIGEHNQATVKRIAKAIRDQNSSAALLQAIERLNAAWANPDEAVAALAKLFEDAALNAALNRKSSIAVDPVPASAASSLRKNFEEPWALTRPRHGAKSTGFNSRFARIPEPSTRDLDLKAVKYPFRYDDNYSSDDHEINGYLEAQFTHPLLDASELRERQTVIEELIQSPDLLDGLAVLLRQKVPSSVRHYGANISLRDFVSDRLFRYQWHPDPSWSKETLKREKEMARSKMDEENYNIEKDLLALFTAAKGLRSALNGARAPRLAAIESVLSAVSDAGHPSSVAPIHFLLMEQDKEARGTGLSEAESQEGRAYISEILLAVRELQMYVSLAEFARGKGWTVFPKILSPEEGARPSLLIESGHALRPLAADPKTSVSNSVSLGGEGRRRFLIVTGPNKQGKSTFIRMIGQLVVLAQMGLPVPAQRMELTPLRVISHMNETDNPEQGQSLFQAEAASLWTKVYQEAAKSVFSLVLLDEMLSGTIESVRKAAEQALIETALLPTGALFVAATHNLDTTSLERRHSEVQNLQVKRFSVLPGASNDLADFNEGALEALEAAGWDSRLREAVRQSMGSAQQ